MKIKRAIETALSTLALFSTLNTCWGAEPASAKSVDEKPVDERKVVVWATDNIPKGTIVKDDDLEEAAIFTQGTPPNTVDCRNEVAGRTTRMPIDCGEIILESDLFPQDKQHPHKTSDHSTCRKATFVCAKRDIPANSSIALSDLQTKSISAFEAESSWLPRADFIVGLKAKENIRSGEILTTYLLDPTVSYREDKRKMNSVFRSSSIVYDAFQSDDIYNCESISIARYLGGEAAHLEHDKSIDYFSPLCTLSGPPYGRHLPIKSQKELKPGSLWILCIPIAVPSVDHCFHTYKRGEGIVPFDKDNLRKFLNALEGRRLALYSSNDVDKVMSLVELGYPQAQHNAAPSVKSYSVWEGFGVFRNIQRVSTSIMFQDTRGNMFCLDQNSDQCMLVPFIKNSNERVLRFAVDPQNNELAIVLDTNDGKELVTRSRNPSRTYPITGAISPFIDDNTLMMVRDGLYVFVKDGQLFTFDKNCWHVIALTIVGEQKSPAYLRQIIPVGDAALLVSQGGEWGTSIFSLDLHAGKCARVYTATQDEDILAVLSDGNDAWILTSTQLMKMDSKYRMTQQIRRENSPVWPDCVATSNDGTVFAADVNGNIYSLASTALKLCGKIALTKSASDLHLPPNVVSPLTRIRWLSVTEDLAVIQTSIGEFKCLNLKTGLSSEPKLSNTTKELFTLPN